MSLLQKIKNWFKPKDLNTVYDKIDNISKSADFVYINSAEGLTEDEFLAVIKNELF